ncbi:LOW QUALITY PROTEIN: protein Dok-7-like [Xyrauchen texanus]|uniref:LOW QUALITY PROTEIN: protein Dok-7-like n=1 Tax=Xyrauchen texanus TaxID=154827 RepID=UPI0022425651|nr:LOW QUALITY PROTEIN: protein Dok-7-like [Xyrauchen texanus]
MTDTVVVEGQVRFREGKKWKNRWVILRKPSPVADCLSLLVYKERGQKSKRQRERSQAMLRDICGLEALQGFDGVNYALSLLCLSQSVMLGFDNRVTLLAWDARIRYSLGEVHRFNVNVQPGTKLESGPASLHLCNNMLVIARDLPPTVISQWKLSDLRRYGAVPNGFVFEGGTRCGYWAGVFFLACAEGEQISFLFDCIVRGISPSRGPFGLRPVLPDPTANPSSVEDRISQEACELEKRLSMLSICSQNSSAASTFSYGASLAGDDRSISSSSSETSHSDNSLGSRLAIWPEPVRHPTPVESTSYIVRGCGSKSTACSVRTSSDERLYGAVVGGLRPPSKPPQPRGLQEAGRQGSTDSGIATGSHSSYSGSFSSYTGSMDIGLGETEEFGSLISLPQNPNSQNSNSLINTPVRIIPIIPEHGSCVSPLIEPAQMQANQYEVPNPGLQHYDIPRRLQHHHTSILEQPFNAAGLERRPQCGALTQEEIPADAKTKQTVPVRVNWCGEGTAPPEGSTMPQPQLTICPDCGGGKVKERSRVEIRSISEQRNPFHETDDPKDNYEQMAFLTDTSRWPQFRSGEYGSMLACPGKTGLTVIDKHQIDSVNYVNIPISPMSKQQLHYMELDLQDRQESSHTVRASGSSTKYAHIDISATETAQQVGAQHAQGREERLQELEQKRKGTLT